MKKVLSVLILSGAVLMLCTGCLNTSKIGNGRIDIGGASIGYVDEAAAISDLYYPGSGKIIRSVLHDKSSVADPATVVPAGYKIIWTVVDDQGREVDIRGYRRVPNLVTVSGTTDYPLQPDMIQPAGQPELDVPDDLKAALEELLTKAEEAAND